MPTHATDPMTDKAATDQDDVSTETPEAGEGESPAEPAAESRPDDPDAPSGGADPGRRGDAESSGDEGAAREPEDAGGDGVGHSPETVEEAVAEAELSQALDELQDEFQELNDRHLRLAAEFTNYRRRQESEMTQAWGRAQSDLLRRFLDVLDDLQRVSGLDPADDAVSVESIVEGVDLVERKFLRTLEDAGVEILEPEGEPFDPEVMEAMMRVPTDSEEDDDLVAQVFQKGYVLKGHLVRPARVSVYKAE